MAIEPTAEEKALREEVERAFRASQDYLKPYRDKCDHLYGLYRSYQALRDGYTSAAPPDKDTIYRDAVREWGAELFIPLAFRTVETILPRAISNRPRGSVLPEDQSSEENVEPMRFLIDRQQDRNRYELKLEDTAKSGFIYGLGAQKVFWRKDYRMRPTLERAQTFDGYTRGEPEEVCVFDDWDVEDIDIGDLFWDPFGYDRDSLRFVIHRTWRDHRYVREMVDRKTWGTEGARKLTAQRIEGMGSGQRYDEANDARLKAAGYNTKADHKQLHEVWEFHDGERVITVLDREVVVQSGPNPGVLGELPFAFFRPTTAGIKQLAGIGSIEPIEHLQREINTLRSQRRDAAALALMQTFAFDDGAIDVDDIAIGPGYAIPVNGSPRDLLFPIPVKDVPFSGYQEEERLKDDVDGVTGISDTVTGAEGGGAAQTATGVQLVQAAASVRIQKQTRRLELETVQPVIEQAILLNQKRIVANRTIRVPHPPEPGEYGKVWGWRQLGPEQLAGLFSYEVEGGSSQPESVPQKRQDAQMKLQLLGQRPEVDQRRLLVDALKDLGFPHPESWLVPEEPSVPGKAIEVAADLYGKGGGDPEAFVELVATAVEMLGQEEEEARAGVSSNGAGPEEAP